jgi:23S rRNA (uracil1939-C5)-methyltransferase
MPATLARDIRFFIKNGYQISSAQGFDMFPQTTHVETVSVLDRIDS